MCLFSRTIAVHLLLASVVFGGTLRAKEPVSRPGDLWLDLASQDEVKATGAALRLAAKPTETLAFLREHLRPVKVDAKRVAGWIAQLDSDDFRTREDAAAELEFLGKYVKPDLERAVVGKGSAEQRKHLQELLDRLASEEAAAGGAAPLTGNNVAVANAGGKITILIDGKPVNLGPGAAPTPRMTWARAVRAVAILEYLGTPEARQLLELLANGESDAPPTKAARAALQSLKDK